MDRQLREMERRIAADGCQQDDVEAFIVRCMRSQSPEFIEATIEKWIKVYNQKAIDHKLCLRRTSHQSHSLAVATINLANGLALVDMIAIDRINVGNHWSESTYVGQLTLRVTGGDAHFMVLDVHLGPGESIWISDFYQRHIEPGQTFTFELTPPWPLEIHVTGVR